MLSALFNHKPTIKAKIPRLKVMNTMKKYYTLFLCALTLSTHSMLFSISMTKEQVQQYQAGKALGFATTQSTFEVYFFSDWQSDGCRKLEPVIEAMAPEIMKHARVFFINAPKPETQNINQVNILYLLDNQKNLQNYLKMRAALFTLGAKTANPTVDAIKEALAPLGINYNPSQNDAEKKAFDLGLFATQSLIRNLHMDEAPTVIVYDLKQSQQKKLIGAAAITQASVLGAIDELKKSQAQPQPEENVSETKKS
jgi:hypothetical protein